MLCYFWTLCSFLFPSPSLTPAAYFWLKPVISRVISLPTSPILIIQLLATLYFIINATTLCSIQSTIFLTSLTGNFLIRVTSHSRASVGGATMLYSNLPREFFFRKILFAAPFRIPSKSKIKKKKPKKTCESSTMIKRTSRSETIDWSFLRHLKKSNR